MATLAQLRTNIATKLVREAVPQLQIDESINDAIAYYKDTHLFFNERRSAFVFTTDDPEVPDIPDDFLYEIVPGGLIIIYDNVRYILEKKDKSFYDSVNVEGQGIPQIYQNITQQLLVYPYPNMDYTGELFYVCNYDDLTEDSDENDWTVHAPQLLVQRTLSQIYQNNVKDENRAATAQAQADKYLDALKKRSDNRTVTGNIVGESVLENQWCGTPQYGGWPRVYY